MNRLTREELDAAGRWALKMAKVTKHHDAWIGAIFDEAGSMSGMDADAVDSQTEPPRHGLMQITYEGFDDLLGPTPRHSIYNPAANIAAWILDKINVYDGSAEEFLADRGYLDLDSTTDSNPEEGTFTMSNQFDANPTVSITAPDGTVYSAEAMTIKSTMLGFEDHGIPTFMLHCEGPSSGIGVGGYRLTGENGIIRVLDSLRVMGVSTWESLVGKQVYVLFNADVSLGERAVGIANPLTGKSLIF